MSGTEIVSTATQVVPAHEFRVVLSTAKTELEKLINEHKDLSLDVSNATAYAKVEHAWRKLYYPRIELGKKVEGTVKDLKSQVKQFQEEGEKVVAEWQTEENRLKAPLVAEDARKKAEKQAKEEAKAARVQGLKNRIHFMKMLPFSAIHQSFSEIQTTINDLRNTELNEAEFGEFHVEAVEVLNASIDSLESLLNAKIETERIAEEQRKLAHELEQKRKEDAEKIAAERAAFEAEQARATAEREEKEKAARQEADARAAELAAQQAELDAANKKRQDELDRQAQTIADQQAEVDRKAKADSHRLTDSEIGGLSAAQKPATELNMLPEAVVQTIQPSLEGIREHLSKWAEQSARFDDEGFDSGEAFDSEKDAYEGGVDDGAISLARAILAIIG